jgi:hypothetical protein
MGIEVVLEILLVWFIIGIVIGGWIAIDTFKRKVEGARWIAAGIFLTVIGLVLYLYVRKKEDGVRSPGFRTAPEFHYDEPKEPAAQPAPAKDTAGPSQTVVSKGPEPERKDQESPKTEEQSKYNTWAPVIKQQIEGAPRCPKCGAAASSFDVFCPDCGARIKKE